MANQEVQLQRSAYHKRANLKNKNKKQFDIRNHDSFNSISQPQNLFTSKVASTQQRFSFIISQGCPVNDNNNYVSEQTKHLLPLQFLPVRVMLFL